MIFLKENKKKEVSELEIREFLLGLFLISIIIAGCIGTVHLVLLYIKAIMWWGRGYI